MKIANEPGSYKDPDSSVFYYESKVCRWINDKNDFYKKIVNSQFFHYLVKNNLFVSTKILHDNNGTQKLQDMYGPDASFFEHQRIGFISYPYEWSFSMIIDAALHTLKLQSLCLENRLSLKDATLYNIQFDHGSPLFIDFGSIENASSNAVWIAYNQFCQHFLYPLFAISFNHSTIPSIYLSHLEGLTLEETVNSLGYKPFWRYGSIFDYLIPALITKNKKFYTAATKNNISISREYKNSTEIQRGTIKRLQKLLKKISQKKDKSAWFNYTKTCLYNEDEYHQKKKFVTKSLQTISVKSVLDIGCNTGDFSIIAAQNGCEVVSIDLDHTCIDHLYSISKGKKYNILPLCINISNPSPAIGWNNSERESFLQRCKKKFECVFGLALIHHLLVTSRIPLSEIVNLFYFLSIKYIVIEFIDTSDKMFKELTKYRKESYNYFNQEAFETSMKNKFHIIDRIEFIDEDKAMNRGLYLMECKN